MTDQSSYLTTENPRIMVVDGSKLTRKLITQVLEKEVPGAEVIDCEHAEQAKQALQNGMVDLVTTALRLPDMDGIELADYIREHTPQAYIPIIVVSGDVQERLVNRSFSDSVTDYFDKALGFDALAAFIKGYVDPKDVSGGKVLYVEDSKVVAMATRRMMGKHGLEVEHVVSAEDALAYLETCQDESGNPGVDIVLTDVYLKSGLTGKDILARVRKEQFGYPKSQLPILVMTGDDNPANQTELIQLGANDLVLKPIEERLLITKMLFQVRVGRMMRERVSQSQREALG